MMKVSLADLEHVADALSVKVSYEDIRTTKGGSCRVMETRRIIINKHLPNSEKIAVLARELAQYDLSGFHIPEHVLRKIRREAEDTPSDAA